MSTVRQMVSDVARAAAVLAMVFLCFAAAPPDLAGPGSLTQQAGVAGTLVQALCGGHDQPQLACHAPNACCRPDQALLPPRTPLPGSAFGRVAAVVYAAIVPAGTAQQLQQGFRSRAPPV